MNLQEYHRQRQEMIEHEPRFRKLCLTCLQPDFSCYCRHIQSFDPQIDFVILIHPIEVRRRIATGRMSHLCLKNSRLIMGQDYTHNEQVNSLLANSDRQSLILYPGIKSVNLTDLSHEDRKQFFVPDKKLQIFVVDGTWATARKMVRQSQNLHSLPRICFSPEKPSSFRVRKQPAPHCYSTIEAIHHLIELAGPARNGSITNREHDKLLYVFDRMVERQLEFVQRSKDHPEFSHHRQFRKRSRA